MACASLSERTNASEQEFRFSTFASEERCLIAAAAASIARGKLCDDEGCTHVRMIASELGWHAMWRRPAARVALTASADMEGNAGRSHWADFVKSGGSPHGPFQSDLWISGMGKAVTVLY